MVTLCVCVFGSAYDFFSDVAAAAVVVVAFILTALQIFRINMAENP